MSYSSKALLDPAKFATYISRNPTLEDQALARIYRLGQRNEVTTFRFYVRDSFEQVSYTHANTTE